MYKPFYTRHFKKDIKRIEKSGNKDIEKLKVVIRLLLEGKQLESFYRDHKMAGNYEGHRECHITPDWLLIYKVNHNEGILTFVRTGSHSELF